MATTINLGYTPRQPFVAFHERATRWACVVAHRRAGKTVACVLDDIDRCLRATRPNFRAAYIGPFYAQAKDAVWDYVQAYALRIPGARARQDELRIDFPNGARYRLYGADNYNRMRGIFLDHATLDEVGDMDPRAWPEVIRPALTDRKGSATFIGTPRGRNAFFDVWQRALQRDSWFAMLLKASRSGLVDPAELEEARQEMTPAQFAQEFECAFDLAVIGAYYAEAIATAREAGRVGAVEADPELPVHTAWDLGIGDSTAIWLWQAAPGGVRVIDHIEDAGHGLPHYAAMLRERGHAYGVDFVPHDAKARELGTGRTRVETLVELGRNPQLVPAHTVDDGINAVRQLLPRMWFDDERCRRGLAALENYRAEYDDKKRTLKPTPRHDWASHSADAFRYLAMAYRELVPKPEHPKADLAKAKRLRMPGPPEPRRGARISL